MKPHNLALSDWPAGSVPCSVNQFADCAVAAQLSNATPAAFVKILFF